MTMKEKLAVHRAMEEANKARILAFIRQQKRKDCLTDLGRVKPALF